MLMGEVGEPLLWVANARLGLEDVRAFQVCGTGGTLNTPEA
jgi:hypothetical protein